MKWIGKCSVVMLLGTLMTVASAADQWRPAGTHTAAAAPALPAAQTGETLPSLAIPVTPTAVAAHLPPTGVVPPEVPLTPPVPIAPGTPAVLLGDPVPAAPPGQPLPVHAPLFQPAIVAPTFPLIPPSSGPVQKASYSHSPAPQEPAVMRMTESNQFFRPMPVGPALAPEPSVTIVPDKPANTDRTVSETKEKPPTLTPVPAPSTGPEILNMPNVVDTTPPTPKSDCGCVSTMSIGAEGLTCTDGSCQLSCTDGCTSCCIWDCVPYAPHCFWISAEYLLWWTKNARTPPLVTTGSLAVSQPPFLGAIGRPDTVVLFGGSIDTDVHSGGRFGAGVWFDECQTCGIDGSFFFLGQGSKSFYAQSDAFGNPVLMRPFVLTGAVNPQTSEAVNDTQVAEQVAIPGLFAGRISARLTDQLLGTDLNLRKNICQDCCCRVDLLAGVRYLRFRESLSITEDFVTLPGFREEQAGNRFIVNDSFKTTNQFFGGQVGVVGEWHWRRWVFDARGKIALGCTQQVIENQGSSQLITAQGAVTNFPGGLYALGANQGRFTRDMFSVVPELGINVGYQITDHITAYVGYTFLYWTNIARPGDQIDTYVNLSQFQGGTLQGPNRPWPPMKSTDFWAQGINFGLAFRY